MPNRLLADTCAALKIAALGAKVFQSNVLPSGDLILHPLLFQETKKWPSARKKKFEGEFTVLGKIRATVNLAPPAKELATHIEVIEMTQDTLGCSIGRVDKNILAAVLFDGSMGLVTNDRSLFKVASDGLEVHTFTAEEILIEAFNAQVCTEEEARTAINRWFETGDGVLKEHERELKDLGLLNS